MVQGPKTTLILQRVTETNSAYGVSESWQNIASLKGVLTGSRMTRNRNIEQMKSEKETVFGRYTFYCDFPSGITITEKDRFSLSERYFEIVFVYNPGNKNQYLEIELDEMK